jgi:hypothetical protein
MGLCLCLTGTAIAVILKSPKTQPLTVGLPINWRSIAGRARLNRCSMAAQ